MVMESHLLRRAAVSRGFLLVCWAVILPFERPPGFEVIGQSLALNAVLRDRPACLNFLLPRQNTSTVLSVGTSWQYYTPVRSLPLLKTRSPSIPCLLTLLRVKRAENQWVLDGVEYRVWQPGSWEFFDGAWTIVKITVTVFGRSHRLFKKVL